MPEKKARDRFIRLAQADPEWVPGFIDKVWWSRVSHPDLHAWTDVEPSHVVQHTADRQDLEPTALACYGLKRVNTEAMLVRLVDGWPVSLVTNQFLGWLAARLANEGKQALLVVWDNASWHVRQAVRTWMETHNQWVKHAGGCP
jgi:hypothetical protein